MITAIGVCYVFELPFSAFTKFLISKIQIKPKKLPTKIAQQGEKVGEKEKTDF